MACKLAIMISGLNLQRDRETDQREMQGHGIWLNSKENITCTTSKLTDVGSKLWSYANACRTQDDDDDDHDHDDDDHELPQAEISLHEVLFRGNHKHPRTNIEAAGNTESIVLSGPVRLRTNEVLFRPHHPRTERFYGKFNIMSLN